MKKYYLIQSNKDRSENKSTIEQEVICKEKEIGWILLKLLYINKGVKTTTKDSYSCRNFNYLLLNSLNYHK